MSSDRQQAGSGLSVTTLLIASASSIAAAVVVSNVWGAGTLIGAGVTPVIVAVVSEALRRPARVITTVRDTRSDRYDPVAEGRRGLREGDLADARPVGPRAETSERRVHTVPGRRSLRLPRPRLIAAVVTGLAAFALGAVLLTSGELVLGNSVGSSSKRTTFVPAKRDGSSTDTTKQDTTSTSTVPAPTTTTPPPANSTPRSTETTPPAQAAPQTTTTAPTTSTPAPAPAPAPQSAAPQTTTTP